MIWRKHFTPEELNSSSVQSIVDHLGIKILELGDDFIVGSMPVDHRTIQPAGILHGGASVVLAETLGSLASGLIIDRDQFIAVGMEVNANHIRSVSNGFVTGKASIIHRGRTTHIWSIEITNEQHQLTCIARLTMAIIPK